MYAALVDYLLAEKQGVVMKIQRLQENGRHLTELIRLAERLAKEEERDERD